MANSDNDSDNEDVDDSDFSTSNHMVSRVIWEKSSRGCLTKFWNHPERSEGDFKILLNNQGMIFPKSPEMTMWFLANHIL